MILTWAFLHEALNRGKRFHRIGFCGLEICLENDQLEIPTENLDPWFESIQ
jgi:hypothetical protein